MASFTAQVSPNPFRHDGDGLAILVASAPAMAVEFDAGLTPAGELTPPQIRRVRMLGPELTRDAPMRDYRVELDLSSLPPTVTRAVRYRLFSTSDLVLQVRLEFARMFRVNDCGGQRGPDGRPLGKPFYHAIPSIILRYKYRIDDEYWERKPAYTGPLNPPMGAWNQKEIVRSGPDFIDAPMIPCAFDPCPMTALQATTPCVPAPVGDPSRWEPTGTPVVQEFKLPYVG